MDQIEKLAPQVAYELGAAVGYVKFAYEQPADRRDRMLSRLSPDHLELVQLYQIANQQ